MPIYYEDLKKQLQDDPEKVLDKVFERKEFWKKKAKIIAEKYARIRKTVTTLSSTVSQLKGELQKEREMKNWWKYVSFSTALACAVICFTFIIHAISANSPVVQGPVEPMSGDQQIAPASVLSSVKILAGKKTGSGTVIAKGDTYGTILTAAHVFSGQKIGQTFWVYFPDGTYTKGTLTAKSSEKDLALATIPANTVLATTPVPEEMPAGDIKLVGYTGGEGPIYRSVNFQNSVQHEGEGMWRMTTINSSAQRGDSGGGVFQQDQLIGVATSKSGWVYYRCNCRWYRQRDDSIYVVPHEYVVEFLGDSIPQESLAAMGDYREQMEVEQLYAGRQTNSADRPPLWSPKPNIPLHLPSQHQFENSQLENRVEMLEKRIMARGDQAPKPDNDNDDLKRPSEIPDPKEGVKPNYDKQSSDKKPRKMVNPKLAAPKQESVWRGEPSSNIV